MKNNFSFIADDFGLNDQTNEAMIYAHHNGALTGAALMMGQKSTNAAVALARQNPRLEIGWHLHIVDSIPMSVKRWPWSTPASAGFAIGFSRRAKALIRSELAAQWQAFLDTGLPCTFINAHHHMCIHPFVRKALVETVGDHFNGWLRWGRPCFFGPQKRGYKILDTLLQKPQIKKFPFKTSSTLWGIDRTFQMQAKEVAEKITTLSQLDDGHALHEFMFHPRTKEDLDTQCLIALKQQYNF